MRTDIDLEIRFEYPDIVCDACSENYYAGWKDGRWEQYYVIPTPDFWGGACPIFFAAREAIMNYFGVSMDAMDATALSTTSPAALASMASSGIREVNPYYTVKDVTTFTQWVDDAAHYRAERLACGVWVVGRRDERLWQWIVEPQRLSDIEMWRLFKSRSKRFMGGRLRSFQWKSLFLAHSSADKEFVRTLGRELRRLGIQVWIDEAEIQIGDSLIERVENAIDEIDYVGVVLTPDAVKSRWVREELRMAMTKQLQRGAIIVLPILLKTTDIPGFLRDKRYANFRDERMFDNGVRALLDRLQTRFPDA